MFVAVAVLGSALTLLAVEPAAATVSYADTVMSHDPAVYLRFGESSAGWTVENEAWRTADGHSSQPAASWWPSGVTFGVAHSGFGGDTAVAFDGSGSARVDTWPFDGPAVSYEMWVKPSSLPAAGTHAALMGVHKCCLGYSVPGLRMELTSSGTVVAEVGSEGSRGLGTTSLVTVESHGAIAAGSWHHLVGIYDPGTKSVVVVVDGAWTTKQDLAFRGLGWNGVPVSYANPLEIGNALPDRGVSEVGFEGSMDEVALYDRTLKLEEVRTDYLASGLSAPTSWNVPEDGSQILGPNGSKTWDELLRCQCVDPVDTGSGNLHMPIASVSVPGRGPGLDVSMAYNSLAAQTPSILGYGWSSTLDMRMFDDAFLDRKVVVQEGGATVPFNAGYGGWIAPASFTAEIHSASGGEWVFTRNHTESFRFDADGRLESISDQYGNTTTVAYPTGDSTAPAFRQASSLTDSAGRSLTLAWYPETAADGSEGKLKSITEPVISGEPAGRRAEFTYDLWGNLKVYKDVAGGSTVFTYDDAEFDPGDHLMTKMRKPRQTDNAKVIENNYDATGRVEWQEDELDRRTDFAYDTPSAGKTTVTMPPYDDSGDPAHRHKRIDTYADGVRTQTITAAGTAAQQTTDFVFDPDTGAPVTITDSAGKTTAFTSDAHGKITSVTDPTGRISRYVNDGPFDQPTSVSVGETTASTAKIVTTANDYDATTGRLEKTTAASGTADAAVTDYVYGDSAHSEDVTKVVDPMTEEWTSGYDPGTGYPLWSENPEHERTVTTYNEVGWPTTVTSPKGVATASPTNDFQTSYSYDIAGRSTTVTGPTGDKAKTVLDANGNTTSTATGAMLGDVTNYTYTAADELATVDPPGTGSKAYTYFRNGAQKTYTNELGAVTAYTYDAGGSLLTETDPAARVTTNTYDPVGRVKTVRQPVTGATCTATTKVGCITYFYDDAGRVTGVDYSDPDTPDLVNGTSFASGIHYDELGRRDAAHAKTGTGAAVAAAWDETWTYSRRSQVTSHTGRSGTTTGYTFNAGGNLTEITYPGSKVLARGFDHAGRLTSTTDWSSRTATFGYDDDSNWTTTEFGTANTDVFGYDATGRMTSATWKQSSTVLGTETYTRPTATKGMVDTLTPTGAAGTAAHDNGYDTRDRLTGTGAEAFTLDPASNLTVGPGGRNQAFDLAQQLCWTSVGTTAPTASTSSPGCPTAPADATTYTSDQLGRRAVSVSEDEDRRTHTYDQASRLTRVVDDNTGTNTPTSAMSDTPVTGDFDHDGHDDVMAYRPGGTDDDPVWWGADRETFGTSTDTYSVTGTYTPLSGDFNGDGYGDIMWYSPGTGTDEVWFWFGRYDGGHDAVTATIDTADYTPFTGDFDGDGMSDIYWYRAGSGTDWIWFGDTDANEDDHDYVQDNEDVSTSHRPVAGDFDNDGKDEIFWYGPGATADFVWDFTTRTSHTSTTKTVNSTGYVLTSGDFNGDGHDDVVFNDWAANSGDTVWWGPGLSTADQRSVNLAAGQLVVAGDFDGDHRDDLFVNQTGTGGDTVWWGTTTKTAFSSETGFALNPTTLDVAYTYDTDGTRASKKLTGATTQKFTYSTGTGLPMLLTEQTGTATTYLIYGPGDQPIEQINPDGTATWLHHDQLGSVRLTTAATGSTPGAEISHRAFDAYGAVAGKAGSQPLLGYAGQYTDNDTGFLYLRARYYDPTTGQFLARDPIVMQTEEAFGYGSGNPVAFVDPSGLGIIPMPRLPSLRDMWDGAAGESVHDVSTFLNHEWEYDWGSGAAGLINIGYGSTRVYTGITIIAGSEFCGPAVLGCAAFGAAVTGLGAARVVRGGRQIWRLEERDGRAPNGQCTTNDNLARLIRGITPFGEGDWLDFLGGF